MKKETTNMANETLVVASKVKTFIKNKAEFKTSSETIEALSKIVEGVIETAIANAKGQGRKTVMARDISTTDTHQ